MHPATTQRLGAVSSLLLLLELTRTLRTVDVVDVGVLVGDLVSDFAGVFSTFSAGLDAALATGFSSGTSSDLSSSAWNENQTM